MKLYILAATALLATLAVSTEAMKITKQADDLKACGDDCNSDADCDSSCPNCFLGACFYFSKDNATNIKGEGNYSRQLGFCCYCKAYFWTNISFAL